jgi:RHH-type proline utilization regulon transcriptional repressor/proline dehydrogenase/delta 1-pyrroline-5-carboxylate dehydrogenase
MAHKFIAGHRRGVARCPGSRSSGTSGIAFSVDLLGEACVSDEEADAYLAKYLDLVPTCPMRSLAGRPTRRLETDHLGADPAHERVDQDLLALSAEFDPIDHEGAIADADEALVPILEAARDRACSSTSTWSLPTSRT